MKARSNALWPLFLRRNRRGTLHVGGGRRPQVPSKRIVNASPLILLGTIDRLDLLFVGVRDVVVPATVIDELGDPRPGNLPGWDQSLPPPGVDADVPIPPDVWRYALDPGEWLVLALALS
jgi:hypothetical protein